MTTDLFHQASIYVDFRILEGKGRSGAKGLKEFKETEVPKTGEEKNTGEWASIENITMLRKILQVEVEGLKLSFCLKL
jgi:hypothetical protein